MIAGSFLSTRAWPDSSRASVLTWWAWHPAEPSIFGLTQRPKRISISRFPAQTVIHLLSMSAQQPQQVWNLRPGNRIQFQNNAYFRFCRVLPDKPDLARENAIAAGQICRSQISHDSSVHCQNSLWKGNVMVCCFLELENIWPFYRESKGFGEESQLPTGASARPWSTSSSTSSWKRSWPSTNTRRRGTTRLSWTLPDSCCAVPAQKPAPPSSLTLTVKDTVI